MEFDSLNAYSGVAAPAPVTMPRTQRIAEPTQTEFDAQDPYVERIVAEPRPDVKADNSNDKSSRDRSDFSNGEAVLARAIEAANKKLVGTNYGFQYSVHEKTKMVMVKVVDSETKEVVREVPPQNHLDAVAKMWELAGILVDEKR